MSQIKVSSTHATNPSSWKIRCTGNLTEKLAALLKEQGFTVEPVPNSTIELSVARANTNREDVLILCRKVDPWTSGSRWVR